MIKIKIAVLVILVQLINGNAQDNKAITVHGDGCWSVFDSSVKYFSDSLVYAKDKEHLPRYLSNPILDWQYRNSLKPCLFEEEFISLRKAIIDRIYDEKVLNWIISSKNSDYDKKYSPDALKREIKESMYNTFPLIPFMQYSWRDLAKKRLEEINKRKRN